MSQQNTVLSGFRTTGKLHLGHYKGAGELLLNLQQRPDSPIFCMLADVQALTDHFDRTHVIRDSVHEVALDILAMGIDPTRVRIFRQSAVPQLSELSGYLLAMTRSNEVLRNPTLKEEMRQKQYQDANLPLGFLTYPVSQAADILGLNATIIPCGKDQEPMIELSRDLARRFNKTYCSVREPLFREPRALHTDCARLPGTDGQKMSKSLGNGIYLSDSPDQIAQKVRRMFTDPEHLSVEQPGKIEGNVVFAYLDMFDPDQDELRTLKAHYQAGGVADSALKQRLVDILVHVIGPISQRRRELAEDLGYVRQVLADGAGAPRATASVRVNTVRELLLGI